MLNPKIREIALFDFDGTITRRDTVIPFVLRCGRGRRLLFTSLTVGVANPRRILARDRDFVKERIIAASISGLATEKLEKAVSKHVKGILRRGLRPDVVKVLDEHRAMGREVFLVSASFGVYLNTVASSLGADAVFATELEMQDTTLTGRLLTRNCRASEKANRVLSWLAKNPTARIVAAYGNSVDDLPMLELAETGFMVTSRGITQVVS